jgi:hypothetical protein
MNPTPFWAKYFVTLSTCRISRFDKPRAVQLVKKFFSSLEFECVLLLLIHLATGLSSAIKNSLHIILF